MQGVPPGGRASAPSSALGARARNAGDCIYVSMIAARASARNAADRAYESITAAGANARSAEQEEEEEEVLVRDRENLKPLSLQLTLRVLLCVFRVYTCARYKTVQRELRSGRVVRG